MMRGLSVVLLLLLATLVASDTSMPCPFTRVLTLQEPPLNGSDVFLLQSLLQREFASLAVSKVYDAKTAAIVKIFQANNKLDVTGELDVQTAELVLEQLINDGYKDDGIIPEGVMYKAHVKVYANRSIETQATLTAIGPGNASLTYVFTARTAGQNDNITGEPLNQLCNDGATPTGLSTFDLNSPENDPVDFGPYPVNRAVQGVKGNAALVISDIRDGILLHTGEWAGWNPSMPMPNSHGCIHAHPTDIQSIWQLLVSIGVQVRNNTFGKLPYPYPAQGLLSVELIS